MKIQITKFESLMRFELYLGADAREQIHTKIKMLNKMCICSGRKCDSFVLEAHRHKSHVLCRLVVAKKKRHMHFFHYVCKKKMMKKKKYVVKERKKKTIKRKCRLNAILCSFALALLDVYFNLYFYSAYSVDLPSLLHIWPTDFFVPPDCMRLMQTSNCGF